MTCNQEYSRKNILKDFKLNNVKLADSKKIWQIRNHRQVRKYSGNSSVIAFKQHRPWFVDKYFSSPRINFCYVLRLRQQVIGYCRLDLQPRLQAYIISIALD